MIRVELPHTTHNPHGSDPHFQRGASRIFRIQHSGSIRSITAEIHDRPDTQGCEFVRFNVPDAAGRFCNPILTMESDDTSVPRSLHRKIALAVGDILHRRYRCQVQVVWSGNKSFHIHFRVHRRNLVQAEVVAIQKYLTGCMERWVRRKFLLPNFLFDRRVMGRLGLVRLGLGVRTQVGGVLVKRKQTVIREWDLDFSDPATIFSMSAGLAAALKSGAARKARYRARKKSGPHPPATTRELRWYADFLQRVGSTVRPSHWGFRGPDRERVMICYYGPRDRNPSCVLALDSYFVTDSRGKRYPVVYSYTDFQEARRNNLTRKRHGSRKKVAARRPATISAPPSSTHPGADAGDLRKLRQREDAHGDGFGGWPPVPRPPGFLHS